MKKYFVILLSCIFNISLSALQQTTADHAITVFVHGTYPIPKILRNSPFRKLMYCPQGLSLAKKLPADYHFHTIAQGCVDLNPSLYSLDQFYVFGWPSEKIYDSVRQQAASDLANALKTTVTNYYAQHGIQPKIRLIGFSHGGNVVLNTANFLTQLVQEQKITTEIWIFGTPVQQINHNLIQSKNFHKVYSIFSQTDWLQRMDPQGLYNKDIRHEYFWSDRMFDKDASCIQINFTVNNKSISHSYYRHIFKYFPIIQKSIENQSQDLQSGIISVDLKI
ncbi:hypothetical protein [Candidatus Chromulinivorax destructor]|uniref:Fungal lipase-like domain-containing protein n=1 Tax=Candidatus Chromulinivorax destructor TaxID=2066483 RepID=A0A345ZBD6_9BACT|nr:hypothetical protein [Candidatus Chromulinivorax destructor]AXK60603.1 hypothetical protein C0J27_02490 [Candidatus Chromulinivorax destructor]